jgi:hypothetical protein
VQNGLSKAQREQSRRLRNSWRVECTFDPTLRQKLPELKNLEPRYITWGEGSSDEMCLGVIAAAKV